MLKYLKKDYNKPSEYNNGITLIRIGVVFLVIFIAVAVMRLLYSPEPLEAAGTRSYTVTHTDHYSGHRYSKPTYYLTLTNDETGNKHHRQVTKDQYERYPMGLKVTLPVYKIDGSVFPSIDKNYDLSKATREYYKYKPTLTMSVCKWALIILGIITFGFIGGGIEQIIKSKNIGKKISQITGISPDKITTLPQPDYDDIFDKDGRL